MNGDAGGLRRLVLNLASNAAKFTPAGTISVTARAIADAHGEWVEITVADTGRGMSAETAAKLGEAFALNSGLVGDGSTSGTGLGFTVCKGIAAAHGGTSASRQRSGVEQRSPCCCDRTFPPRWRNPLVIRHGCRLYQQPAAGRSRLAHD